MAIVPQRTIAAYNSDMGKTYKQGDLAVLFAGCEHETRSCTAEMDQYWQLWTQSLAAVKGT
jgi:hypothetical protein